jgi:hypothetical protein
MQKCKAGMMEYELESTFLNACYAQVERRKILSAVCKNPKP